jgi:hypothetical protein
MTLKPVNDDIIFLKENVYDMMRLRANYSLAFCSKMLNHHGLKFGKKDNFNNTYGCVRKVNFYSLIEDMIVCLGKSSYNPEVSLKRAQESLYGKEKEISFKDKLSKIRDNLMRRKKLGFRLEVTVEL